MNLSSNELSQLRTDAESYQPDSCAIKQVTTAADTIAGWSETLTDRATGVTCRLAPIGGGGEDLEGEQIASRNAYMLTIPHDQTIEPTDRVVLGSVTYEVEKIDDEHSNRTAKRVVVRVLE